MMGTHIDVEDMALLEDEVSQLRSENEYLKITVDALTLENTELRAKTARLEAQLRTLVPYQEYTCSLAVGLGFD